ncbi:MAG: hypothetical protein AAGF97_03480 [Planctomycetota bacterium]
MRLVTTLACVLLFAICFAGCSGESGSDSSPAPADNTAADGSGTAPDGSDSK